MPNSISIARQLHAGQSPLDGDDPVEIEADRMAGIVAGNEARIARAVANMLLRGGGLSLAATRDGGAVCLTWFYFAHKVKKYYATPEALGGVLDAVAQWEPAQPTNGAVRPSQAPTGHK